MTVIDTGYDYIVVGAGTAGCVVAARLSEDPDVQVLLLEAGAAEPLPAMAFPPVWPTLEKTSADWSDETVTLAADGSAMRWPRGRGLGGSTSINGMSFLRGHRSSYDAWGAPGWGFDALLPFFRRSERVAGRDPGLRGTDGPLIVDAPAHRHPLAAAGLDAALEVGHQCADDVGSGVEQGFGWCDLNVVEGRRQSSADAYLNPALGRPNIHVVTRATAERVTIVSGRCVGVSYRRAGSMVDVACTSEVVLACGTIGSPQLLMLSGIGPEPHLTKVGIPIVAAVPGVGMNLHDHPMCSLVYRARRSVPPGENNHGEVVGLLRSDMSLLGPDVQVMFVDLPLHVPSLSGPASGRGYSIAVSLMLPSSRGTLRLRGDTQDAGVRIDPNYYGERSDRNVMVAGLRAARRIGDASALGSWREHEVLPGPGVQSTRDLDGYLDRNLRSYHHYGGTCSIGEENGAVVDSELRVRGIDGIRVADASVMPAPVSANTVATVYAIAERAAELIRGAPRDRTPSGLLKAPARTAMEQNR